MEAPDPRRWMALAVVCVAFFMTVLDVSIVNVALPSIGTDLHFTESTLQWVITAYAITFGGFLLLGGRAADLLGRRKMFVVGVILFTIASFACGLSSSDTALIAARAVQGLGAALVTPAGLSIVSTTFTEGAERNKALGIWGAVGGSGAAVGVLAGGLLTEYLGWEWIFFVNVPVGIAVLAVIRRFVHESRAEGIDRAADPLGAITITAGLALLVYTISNAPRRAGRRPARSASASSRCCCSRASCWSSRASARRSCGCRSSGTRPSRHPTSSASCSAPRCSRTSSC